MLHLKHRQHNHYGNGTWQLTHAEGSQLLTTTSACNRSDSEASCLTGLNVTRYSGTCQTTWTPRCPIKHCLLCGLLVITSLQSFKFKEQTKFWAQDCCVQHVTGHPTNRIPSCHYYPQAIWTSQPVLSFSHDMLSVDLQILLHTDLESQPSELCCPQQDLVLVTCTKICFWYHLSTNNKLVHWHSILKSNFLVVNSSNSR